MADLTVGAETCVALGATEHQFESFPGRDIALGALTVTRVLPVKGKRLVGPWCFLDRFGPMTFANPSPMDVGAHPHMGLQTVTWLLDGEIVHYDSLGYEVAASPRRRQRHDLGRRHRPRGADTGPKQRPVERRAALGRPA
jgi:hypothetical protein